MTVPTSGPLAGVRVLDLAGESGVFVGRALAELGADVIRVESGADRVRRREPFLGGIAGPERSLHHLHFNAGKRSVQLDLHGPPGQAGLRALALAADLVVTTPVPGEPDVTDIGPLRAANPGLISVIVTPYARDSPFWGEAGSDLTAVAAGGLMYLNGFPEEPPVRPGAEQGYHMGSLVALATSLLALAARERDPRRRGAVVEVSLQEAVSMATLQTANANLYTWHGLVPRRRGLTGPRGERSLFECRDGRWISFVVPLGAPALWSAFTDWVAELGIDSPYDAREWSRPEYRAAHPDITAGIIGQLCRLHDRDELFHEGQRRRMLAMPASTAADLAGSEHLAQRSFLVATEHEHLGRELTDVSAPYRFSATPARLPRRAPRLGEHTAEVLSELAGARRPGPADAEGEGQGEGEGEGAVAPGGLLEGIRVADFCWLIAGPSATRMLADYGADVIKIESRSRLDNIRAIGVQPGEPGSIDTNGVFNDCNTGKRSVTLNLGHPRGIELAKELVARSDVVTNNFTGDRMDRWGLGYDDLRAINPGVIMLTMPALGATGPFRRYGSYGNGLIAFSGLNQDMGFAGDPPLGMAALYSDFSAPYAAVAAIAAALYHRERTGEGQFIELAQAEATMNLLGTDIVEYTANGDLPPRLGNRSRDDVPHGAYPCAGDDRWCAIAVRTDAEWQALARAVGGAADGRFASRDGRRAHEDEIDALITAWTSAQDAPAAARQLQEAGVPAHVVADLSDLLSPGEGLLGRHIVPVERDGLTFHTHAQPALVDGQRTRPRAAPRLGEHNAEVFTTLLGLTPADIDELAEAGVIY